MKKSIFYFLLAFSLITLSCADSQEMEESNTLRSLNIYHESVSSIDLTGIEIIDGPVHIVNTDAKDLSFLNGIKEIRGILDIGNNKHLESLNGLENLQSVGDINIFLNDKLLDISALTNVEITEYFSLHQNGISRIQNLDGLINSSKQIYINEPIESLDFLANLKSVSSLSISNSNLKDLSGLKNLEEVGFMSFRGNILLEDFCEIKDIIVTNDTLTLRTIGNRFNPTIQEIIANCE